MPKSWTEINVFLFNVSRVFSILFYSLPFASSVLRVHLQFASAGCGCGQKSGRPCLSSSKTFLFQLDSIIDKAASSLRAELGMWVWKTGNKTYSLLFGSTKWSNIGPLSNFSEKSETSCDKHKCLYFTSGTTNRCPLLHFANWQIYAAAIYGKYKVVSNVTLGEKLISRKLHSSSFLVLFCILFSLTESMEYFLFS